MAMNFDWVSAICGAAVCYFVAPKVQAASDAVESMKNAPSAFAKAMAEQGKAIAEAQKAEQAKAEKEKAYDQWLAANPNASAAQCEAFRRSLGL